jgi:hypothetical protein
MQDGHVDADVIQAALPDATGLAWNRDIPLQNRDVCRILWKVDPTPVRAETSAPILEFASALNILRRSMRSRLRRNCQPCSRRPVEIAFQTRFWVSRQ